MSVMPVSGFAMNSSNNATEASNHTNDLEKSFILPLVSNDTGETVSTLSCDVYVKIDDGTCVGYDVYVDGVYQFTEGQSGTPDGYCAFYVTAGTHTLEIRKNGRSATKTINFQCGITYRWVSMPDNWCIGGGEGTKTCINFDELGQGDITGQTLHYDQVDFVAEGGDSPYGGHVVVQSLAHSLPNGIGLSPGHVTASFKVPVSKVSLWVGDWAGGTTITLYAPSGWCLEEVIAQERDFTYYEFSYAGKIASVRISSSEGAFDDFCFEIEDASPCKVYVIIDDNTCTGYEVYVDGVYQFTEGQDGTPDGDCAFYVTAGTHTLEIRKNGRSATKTINFQCGYTYRWVSMPDNWCEGEREVKFRGELTGTGPEGMYGVKHWYVKVNEYISGALPLICDEIDVYMGIYPPMGSFDVSISKGDRVEAFGSASPSECTVNLNGESYYIKRIDGSSCGKILAYAISDGTYPPGQKVIADMMYKSLLSTSADFKGVFKVRSPTGDIYTYNSKKESTPAGHEDYFGYNRGNHFTIQIPEDASLGWYDAKLELRNFYTDELCDETGWIDNQFKIEDREEIKFKGTAIEYFSRMGACGWTVRADEIINGPSELQGHTVSVALWSVDPDQYPPGYIDPNIEAGNKVEVYGLYVGEDGVTLSGSKDYYIKRGEGCGRILDSAITEGSYTLPQTVMAHMKYKNYMKSPTKFKGVFLVKNQRTGKIYSCSKEQITNIDDRFGYGKGNSLQIRFEDEVEDIGVYDAKLELRNFYTDELCDETEWLEDQFKIESSGATGIDYKFDEYGVIQQAYDAEYALNMAFPPMGQIRKSYINLIPYSEAAKGSTESIFIKVNNGEITQYSPQENAILSADKGTVTWQDVPILDDYHAELFYEAEFAHPQEIAIEIIPSDTEIKAEIKNIADYPAYNLIVLYPEKPGEQEESLWTDWHYGMVDLLAEGEQKTLVLSDGLPPETVKATLYDYLTHGLDDAGLDSTQHRNDWINEWIDEWLGRNNNPFVARSSLIYRIPQELYGQYFASNFPPCLQCWPKQGMVRVGLVELYDLPAGTPPKTIYVDDDFVDDPPNHKWDAIQEGVDDAEDGDTVLVYSGTYNENVCVNKSIVLKGIDYPVVVSGGFIPPVGDNALEGVTVDGFNLTGGIGCFAVNNSMFLNNTISNSQYVGMLFEWSYNNIIKGNEILGNRYGIQLFARCCNNTIVGNNITNNHIGINLLEFAGNNTIYHNNFNNNAIQANDGVDPALYGTNSWNNGYPSGGNYWSDYEEKYKGEYGEDPKDEKNGPNQDQPGSDGIWDKPYKWIDGKAGAKDNYPLMGEPPELPDLTFSYEGIYSPDGMFISPEELVVGEPVTVNVMVESIGKGDATDDFYVKFYLGDPDVNNDGVIDDDANEIGSYLIDWTIHSGVGVSVPITWTPSEAGTFDIYAVIDPEIDTSDLKIGSVAESDEGNNEAYTGVNVIALLRVPYFNQGSTGWCTLNSIAMVLQYYGVKDHSWDLAREFNQGHDGAFDTAFDEIKDKKLTNYIENKNLALRVDGVAFPASLPFFISYIKNPIDAGKPIIISYHRIGVGGHSIVIVGYSIKDGTKYVYIHDPSGVFFSDADNMFIKVPYQNLYNDLAPLPLFYTFEISGESPDPPQEVIWVEDGINWDEDDYGDITHTVIKPSSSGLEESYILLDEGLKYKTKEILIPGFPEPPKEASWLRFLDKPQEGWTDTNNLYVVYHVSNPHPYPIEDCQVCAEIQDISSGEILHEPKCKPLSVDKQTKGYDVILLDLREIPIDGARTCNLMIKSDNDEIGPIKINFVTPIIAKKYLPNIYQLQCDIDEPADNGFIKVGYIIKEIGEDEAKIEYNLVFKDEDDPNLDIQYDGIRKLLYGRIEDIEGFSVIVDLNEDKIKEIEFDGSWHNDWEYYDPAIIFHNLPIDIVGDTRTFTDTSDFTVSNGHLDLYVGTWNHFFSNTADINGIPCNDWEKVADFTLNDEKFVNKDRKELEDEYKG